MILGIDEVGLGPYAGPICVGAVVLGDYKNAELTDSKKLSAKKREKLAHEIKQNALDVQVGWASRIELDMMGRNEALKLAMRRAIGKITHDYDRVIIDGILRLIDDPRVMTMPKADSLIPEVSAASIVAKVARDLYMTKLAEKYPEYGFDKHMGYGTKAHREALAEYGLTPEHRLSYAPIAKIAGIDRAKGRAKPEKNTTKTGNLAEDEAVKHLERHGHEILERNWKTKICEIDIVSQKDQTIYFTEVKYRQNKTRGDGLQVIDERKQRQMRFAAEVFLQNHKLNGKIDAILSAISLSGKPPEVEQYLAKI
jgi:ribonuclease HII